MKTDILILDGESSFALSVVRSLAQTRRWRIHVLGGEARPKCPALQWSRHIESYRHIREGVSDDATVETIKRAVGATGAKLIVPVTEPTSLLCIRYRAELENVARLAVLPTEKSFTTAIDKGLLAGFCVEHGIPHPATVLATEGEKAELRFPVLLKPRRLSGGRGIRRIESAVELESVLSTCDKTQHCVQQGFEGMDVGCSVLVNEGKIVASTVQQSLQRSGPFAVAGGPVGEGWGGADQAAARARQGVAERGGKKVYAGTVAEARKLAAPDRDAAADSENNFGSGPRLTSARLSPCSPLLSSSFSYFVGK